MICRSPLVSLKHSPVGQSGRRKAEEGRPLGFAEV